jgi:hypothetical protein
VKLKKTTDFFNHAIERLLIFSTQIGEKMIYSRKCRTELNFTKKRTKKDVVISTTVGLEPTLPKGNRFLIYS